MKKKKWMEGMLSILLLMLHPCQEPPCNAHLNNKPNWIVLRERRKQLIKGMRVTETNYILSKSKDPPPPVANAYVYSSYLEFNQ